METVERAKDLITKFGYVFGLSKLKGRIIYKVNENRKEGAIKNALIHVDGIIEVIKNIEEEQSYGFGSDDWMEVKKEIENL